MKLLNLLISSILATVINAAMLAPDLPDGVYHAFTDENGVETHIRLVNNANGDPSPMSWTYDPRVAVSNSTVSSTAELDHFSEPLEKRTCAPGYYNEYANIFCGCTFNMNPSNCDAAVADLKNQIGSGYVTPTVGHAWYSIRGSVVAFICETANKGASMSAEAITTACSQMTDRCGYYIAGTWEPTLESGEDVGFNIGYMRYSSGLDFCKNALTSGQNCCA